MDVHRFSRNDDFADQALGYGLTFFKPTLSTPTREKFDKADRPLPQTSEGF